MRGSLNGTTYNEQQRKALDWLIRGSGLTEDDVRNARIWKPLGTYILQGKPEDATLHQKFLRTFTHMQWRQYSALSHASFDGYIGELPPGAYFVLDRFSHVDRSKIEQMYLASLTRHIGRAAMVLLCIVTELQLYFRFDGHEVNERIRKMWAALIGVFEVKEIYDERYRALMIEREITPGD